MLESVREIKFRTIVLVAAIVWGVLAALWFVTLNRNDTVPAPKTAQAQTAPKSLNSTLEPGSTEGTETRSTGVTGPGTVVRESDSPPPPVAETRPDHSNQYLDDPKGFFLQLGAFKSRQGADELSARLRRQGIETQVEAAPSGDEYYRVLCGPFTSPPAAHARKAELKMRGIDSFLRTSD